MPKKKRSWLVIGRINTPARCTIIPTFFFYQRKENDRCSFVNERFEDSRSVINMYSRQWLRFHSFWSRDSYLCEDFKAVPSLVQKRRTSEKNLREGGREASEMTLNRICRRRTELCKVQLLAPRLILSVQTTHSGRQINYSAEWIHARFLGHRGLSLSAISVTRGTGYGRGAG